MMANKNKDREADLPVYNTQDEIPTYEKDVPPINMDGLPEYNLIRKFMNNPSISESYPEYAMQGAFTVLAATARRRISVRVNSSDKFPQLWMVALGPSGIGGKSKAINITKETIESVIGEAIILSDEATLAGFVADMATKTSVRGTGKNSTEWTDISEKYADEECRILRSERVYIRDEASQMFAQMQKHGKDSLEPLLLKLHGGKTYKKLLVRKKELVEDPFFSMFVATTTEGLTKNITKANLESGFLGRNQITNPHYEKAWKPLKEDIESEAQVNQDLIDEFKLLDSVLGDSIRAGFQEEALNMLNEWVEERITYYKKERDEDHLVLIPRFQENAISMALLIELGNIPHNVGENKNVVLKGLKITTASMGFALKLIDSVFAPYMNTLALRDEYIRSEKKDVARIERLLMNHRKLDHSTVLHNTKINKKRLAEIIDTLIEAGVVELCKAKKDDSRQKGIWYVYVPPDTNKFVFKTDYRTTQINEYTPEMTFEPKPELMPEFETDADFCESDAGLCSSISLASN